MTVPYAFTNSSGNIALAKLDANFNTPITIGNTSVLLGNTVTTLNNLTLANVTISSGNIGFTIPVSSGGTGLVAPGNVGNVLTSTGSAWVSSASSGSGNGAPTNAAYVLVSSSASLTSGRVLTAGANVTITDNGAGNSIVIDASGGGGGSGGMTLLATLTPTSGSTSASVTGLSSSKSIVVITNGISSNPNLDYYNVEFSTNNGSSYNGSSRFTSQSSTAPTGWIQLYSADSGFNRPSVIVYNNGSYVTLASVPSGAINAVRINTTLATFSSGSVLIYGVN